VKLKSAFTEYKSDVVKLQSAFTEYKSAL